MPRSIRVLVADNQPLYRVALVQVLVSNPDIEVVAAVADGGEALRLTAARRPDVVITEVFLPGLDGIALTKQVRERYPDMRVIILSGQEEDDLVFDAVRAGASAYLSKAAEQSEILEAVRAVYEGKSVLSPSIARKLMQQCSLLARWTPSAAPVPAEGAPGGLTGRELEILRLVAAGASNREIATRLSMSERTVERHIANIYRKLGISSRSQATLWAVQHGLLSEGEASFGASRPTLMRLPPKNGREVSLPPRNLY